MTVDSTLAIAADVARPRRPQAAELAVLAERVERDRLVGLAVVGGDDVLALVVGVDATERVHARVAARVAMDLGAVGQRRVLRAQAGQVSEVLVQGMVGVEVGVGSCGVGADQVVVVVRGDLRREHVLPGVLVAAVADETLLVAVVHDRLPAGEVHQRVREAVARQQLVAAGTAVAEEPSDATHVVVAEERRQRVRVRVGVGVVVVVGEQVAELDRRTALGESPGPRLEAEVDRGLQAGLGRVARHERRVLVEHLAEREEVRVAVGFGPRRDRRRERLPELDVDVLHGVDPEPVDAEVDPRLVDVGHPGDDVRVFGEQVVEPEEVAVLARLAGERRVAAVVVVAPIVEPCRHLHRLVLDGPVDRRVRERHRGIERRERARPGEVTVVERLERVAADVRLGRLVDVRVACPPGSRSRRRCGW